LSNEINLVIQYTVQNGNYADTVNYTHGLDQAAIGEQGQTLSVPTTGVAVTNVLTTPGYCYLLSLDSTNYVDFGPDNGGTMLALGRLKAGEACIFRLHPGTVLRFVANAAAVLVQVKIWSD
jgi:hypothetical protein